MAWTAPATFVGGQIPTAALLNAQIRDNLLETMPAKATTNGSIFVATGLNTIAERFVDFARLDVSESRSFGSSGSSYGDLSTVGPSVTLITGSSALVFHNCGVENSSTNAGTHMSWAVTGATSVSATDARSLYQGASDSGNHTSGGMVDLITTLTPGTNTFTAKYKVSAGTGTFHNRMIAVVPVS